MRLIFLGADQIVGTKVDEGIPVPWGFLKAASVDGSQAIDGIDA
jgi:hypothetical protein